MKNSIIIATVLTCSAIASAQENTSAPQPKIVLNCSNQDVHGIGETLQVSIVGNRYEYHAIKTELACGPITTYDKAGLFDEALSTDGYTPFDMSTKDIQLNAGCAGIRIFNDSTEDLHFMFRRDQCVEVNN